MKPTKGPKPGGVRQLHVNFSDGAYEALQELCEAQSKTMTEVLRDAITLERSSLFNYQGVSFKHMAWSILLIIPPTRAIVRRIVLRSYRARMARGGGMPPGASDPVLFLKT